MAALWLADVDGSERASGTKRLYRFVTDSYVLPALGELRLREVTVPALDRLLTSVHSAHGPARPRPRAASSPASSASPSGTDCSPPTRSARHLPAEGRATPAAVLERSPSRRHTSCGPGWPMTPPPSARTCPSSSPSCSAPGCASADRKSTRLNSSHANISYA